MKICNNQHQKPRLLKTTGASLFAKPMQGCAIDKRLLHTYLIDHYNPSVKITTNVLISLMLHVMFWWDLQFKGNSVQQIFTKLLIDNFIYSRNFLKEFAEELFISLRFIGDISPGVSTNGSCLIKQQNPVL